MSAIGGKPRVAAGPGRLIVLSGPSGVGKDTVLRELRRIDPTLRYSVSYTTRQSRPGEVDGESYSFVDEPTFRAMADRDEFLEWAVVHEHLYGTSQQRVQDAVDRGEDIVLKIDVQGGAWVRGRVSGETMSIFLTPPSTDELRRRLIERATESPADLEVRINNAVGELDEARNYDHCIVNDSVGQAARQILDLIEASRGARAVRDA